MGIYPSYYEVNGEKKQIIGTQFETTAARQAFPCVDEPEAKATFDLAIKYDEHVGETILSNMPEKRVEDGVHYFDTTVRMSTYLIAFAFGELQGEETKTKSGDSVTVNAKNQAQYTTVLKTKLIFVTNNMPTTSDTSDGFSRRLNILPFQVQVPLEKVDVDLEGKLATELSGILNWALVGLGELRKNNFNFTSSKAMREAKDSYMLFSRPVERFIKGCLVENHDATLSMKYLREQYSQWIKSENIADRGTTNSNVFSKKLREAFQSLWGQPAPIVNMHGHINGLSGYDLRKEGVIDEQP